MFKKVLCYNYVCMEMIFLCVKIMSYCVIIFYPFFISKIFNFSISTTREHLEGMSEYVKVISNMLLHINACKICLFFALSITILRFSKCRLAFGLWLTSRFKNEFRYSQLNNFNRVSTRVLAFLS